MLAGSPLRQLRFGDLAHKLSNPHDDRGKWVTVIIPILWMTKLRYKVVKPPARSTEQTRAGRQDAEPALPTPLSHRPAQSLPRAPPQVTWVTPRPRSLEARRFCNKEVTEKTGLTPQLRRAARETERLPFHSERGRCYREKPSGFGGWQAWAPDPFLSGLWTTI